MSLETFTEAARRYSRSVIRANAKITGDGKLVKKLNHAGFTAYTDKAGKIAARKDVKSGEIKPLDRDKAEKAERGRDSRIRRGKQDRADG